MHGRKEGVLSSSKREKDKALLDNVNECIVNKMRALVFNRLAKHNIKSIAADLEAVKKVLHTELQKMTPASHNAVASKCRNNGHIRTKSDLCGLHGNNAAKKPRDELVKNLESLYDTPLNSDRLKFRRKSNLADELSKNEEEKAAKKTTEGSTKGTTESDCENSGVSGKLTDLIAVERENIVKHNVEYVRRNRAIPATTAEQYKFVKLIGKGAFGKVALGIHKLTGKYVAIKTIDKSYMKDASSRRKVFREVFILKKIRHANVIRLLEVFESAMHLLMVMEYAGGGDLLKYVKKRKRLSECEARSLFKQIVYGLGHVHSHSVLHRDIKLDNILLDDENRVKICDFGVSKIVENNAIITEQCGTPAYIAPEIISSLVIISSV